MGARSSWMRRLPLVMVAAAAIATVAATTANAASPEWSIAALANSTVAPGDTVRFFVQVENVGDAPADGRSDAWVLTADLPSGLQATGVSVVTNPQGRGLSCFGTIFPSSSVTCRDASESLGVHQRALFAIAVRANAALLPGIVEKGTFGISGGGVASAQSAVATVRIANQLSGFGVDKLDGAVTADAVGTPSTQAGAHPYAASVSFDINTVHPAKPVEGDLAPVEPLKDAFADLPPGLAGDPSSVAQCTIGQLANAHELDSAPLCPPESQVGTALVRFYGTGLIGIKLGPVAVFNMVPPSDAPARFGFNILGSVVTLDAKLQPGPDYGLTIAVANAPEAIPLMGSTVTLWGDPASPVHDAERSCPNSEPPAEGGPSCPWDPSVESGGFVRNPTSCTAPADSPVQDGLVTTLHLDSWVHPGAFRADGLPDLSDPAWKSATFVTHAPPGYPEPSSTWGRHLLPTGCNAVPFDPALAGQPDAGGKPASPSGFSFDLTLPQDNAANRIAEGDLKRADVVLPAGLRVSPSSANGLEACSSAQIGLDVGTAPTCPDASKIGTARIDTPLLPDPLTGNVYLATQGDNPFRSLLAIYLVAHGPGFYLKLPGHVQADARTGQLSTTFDNNPQLPFTRLHLQFYGGDRAPLVLPNTCGRYTTQATLTSWSGKTVQSDSTFTVDGTPGECNAHNAFTPTFRAATTDTDAGADSAFNLRFTRGDRQQQLAGVTMNLPSGLTGRIANVDQCGEAEAAAGTCPEASRVGSVTVGAGAGPDPFYISSGRAYLTGPYRGAPFGLSIVVPAKAGPFDLGNVTVRSALFVDKHTANVTVVSDPLPQIVDGIPLDVRDVRVSVDREHFFVNPMSCAEKTIYGLIDSAEGAHTHVTSRFQVGRCGRLPLHPTMRISVGSKRHTGRNAVTPFVTKLTQTPGQTNLKRVVVTLPKTLNARLNVVQRACTRDAYEQGDCEQARAGSAVAVTPLLRDPLRGGVYFVRNGRPLPDLFVRLHGQVDFDLIGRVAIPGSTRLRTIFNAVPDVPIRSFTLRLVAGSHGPIGAVVNLCSKRGLNSRAGVSIRGQNGKARHLAPRLNIRGCPAKHKAKGAKRGRGAGRGR